MKPFRTDPGVVKRLRRGHLKDYPETITLLSMFLLYRDLIADTSADVERNYCTDDDTVVWRMQLRQEMKNIAWHLKREDGIEPCDITVLQEMDARRRDAEASDDSAEAQLLEDRMVYTFIRTISDRTWEGNIVEAADFLAKALGLQP